MIYVRAKRVIYRLQMCFFLLCDKIHRTCTMAGIRFAFCNYVYQNKATGDLLFLVKVSMKIKVYTKICLAYRYQIQKRQSVAQQYCLLYQLQDHDLVA